MGECKTKMFELGQADYDFTKCGEERGYSRCVPDSMSNAGGECGQ